MSEPAAQKFMVSIQEPEENGAFIFTFAPKGLQAGRGPNGLPKRVQQFVVAARQEAGELVFDWGGSSDDPGAAREEIEAEISVRMKDRAIWISRVNALVNQFEQWARELGWSTRRVEKKLEDTWIGKHRVPALLMQEDTCRILLEPVGRSAPGAEGVVDLYLMPAYDDIATLYFYGNQWNLHYMFPGTEPAATTREAPPRHLSKETIEAVLAQMKQHAA